jgi:two-component system, OmpR family, sensor kinase
MEHVRSIGAARRRLAMKRPRSAPARGPRHLMRNGLRSVRHTFARLPIRWRLALASFGLLALLLGALGALVSVTLERALLGNEAATLRQEARLASGPVKPIGIVTISPSAHPPPVGAVQPTFLDPAAFFVRRLASVDIGVAVITPAGQVVVASGDIPQAPPAVTLDQTAIRRALTTAQQDTSYLVVRDSAGNRQLVVVLPLVDVASHTTVALLQLSTPTAPIDRAVATITLILGLGIAAALVIAGALTLPLMRAALRPLEVMERTSARIADGALSLRLDIPPTHDEIGRLARSFNTMVARLEEVFLRQKQFVADVSHELRTPLTALGGGLEMLLLGADRGDPDASRRLVRGMYAEVERMRRLVGELLTLTQIDEGRIELRLTDLDIGTLLAEMCEQARQLASGQTVGCEVAPDVPRVRADPDRLRQVLLILIENALKYSPPPARVDLVARGVDGDGVAIAVRDTGVGIAADVLPHVFGRFYRADPARARNAGQPGGAGLGLAIAQSLVAAHGGQISIASRLGDGTTVTIRLPAAPFPPLPAPSGEDSATPSAAGAATLW